MLTFALSLFLSQATAGTAVVPLLHGQGVDSSLLLNLSQLLADEVRLHNKYSEVILLNAEESKIDPDCLRRTTCVYKHAKKKRSRTAVAGKVFVTGEKLEFYIVLCERGYFKRKIRFQLDNDILAIAEGLSPHIEELVLGKSKKKKTTKTTEPMVEEELVQAKPVILNKDEQVDITIDDSETENLMGDDLGWDTEDVPTKPISKEQQKADDRKKLERAQERERLERERREKAERERLERERIERERREKAERERLERERIERERLERERREKERIERERREKAERERLERERKRNQSSLSEEEQAEALLAQMREKAEREKAERERARKQELEPVTAPPKRVTSDFDLDEPEKPKKKKRKIRKKPQGDYTKAKISARVGFAKFQSLDFITYGGEISYFPVPNMDIVVGAEAYATRRPIPSEYLEEGESPLQWNTILPINVGALYHIDMEAIKPYVGADVIMIPGYIREANNAAMGIRLRGGIDFPVAETLHFNVNLSAGFWSGEDFKRVQADLSSFGLVPQLSGGTSFLF